MSYKPKSLSFKNVVTTLILLFWIGIGYKIWSSPFSLIVPNVKSIINSAIVSKYFLGYYLYYCIAIVVMFFVRKIIFQFFSFGLSFLSSLYVGILLLNGACQECGNSGLISNFSITLQTVVFLIIMLLSAILLLTISDKRENVLDKHTTNSE